MENPFIHVWILLALEQNLLKPSLSIASFEYSAANLAMICFTRIHPYLCKSSSVIATHSHCFHNYFLKVTSITTAASIYKYAPTGFLLWTPTAITFLKLLPSSMTEVHNFTLTDLWQQDSFFSNTVSNLSIPCFFCPGDIHKSLPVPHLSHCVFFYQQHQCIISSYP